MILSKLTNWSFCCFVKILAGKKETMKSAFSLPLFLKRLTASSYFTSVAHLASWNTPLLYALNLVLDESWGNQFLSMAEMDHLMKSFHRIVEMWFVLNWLFLELFGPLSVS